MQLNIDLEYRVDKLEEAQKLLEEVFHGLNVWFSVEVYQANDDDPLLKLSPSDLWQTKRYAMGIANKAFLQALIASVDQKGSTRTYSWEEAGLHYHSK